MHHYCCIINQLTNIVTLNESKHQYVSQYQQQKGQNLGWDGWGVEYSGAWIYVCVLVCVCLCVCMCVHVLECMHVCVHACICLNRLSLTNHSTPKKANNSERLLNDMFEATKDMHIHTHTHRVLKTKATGL